MTQWQDDHICGQCFHYAEKSTMTIRIGQNVDLLIFVTFYIDDYRKDRQLGQLYGHSWRCAV